MQIYLDVTLTVYAPCNIARYIKSPDPIPDANYDITSGVNASVATLTWTHTGKYSICGPIIYTIREYSTNAVLPSTIKLPGANIIFVNANNYI